MVFINPIVYAKIDANVHYIVTNGFVRSSTAVGKSMAILNRLNSLDSEICTDRPSTHRSFGKRQGFLMSYGRYYLHYTIYCCIWLRLIYLIFG